MAQQGFADCPDCGADVRLKGKPFIGQILYCNDCRTMLEVDQLNPVFLLVAEWFAEDMVEAPRRHNRKSGRRTQYMDD